jgi:hypothetical protein
MRKASLTGSAPVYQRKLNINIDSSAIGTGIVGMDIHKLAKGFNGLHWAVGITTLPDNASPREERSFVLMWLGIIFFMAIVFAIMLYLLR